MENKLRNVAIVAHVDHGKTTLVDQLLKQNGIFHEKQSVPDRVMDSGDLEREKGITILAKTTSVHYKDHKINIVDTPGHADFGGEVERIMRMVDGIILIVDAFEGCKPQTRFVLQKALDESLVPIVVINKMDRPFTRPDEVLDEVIDLFIDLGATEEQLDFPVIYASALSGKASLKKDQMNDDMTVLLDAIIDTIPAPSGDSEKPLQMQVALMEYNEYVGKIAIGTVKNGQISVGETVEVIERDGKSRQRKIVKMFTFEGLSEAEIKHASAGEIVAISGLDEIEIGETICKLGTHNPLPNISIAAPTIEMIFLVNDSPLAGEDGDPITSRKLLERLNREQESDVALRVEAMDEPDKFKVSGRGELHLSILVEKMRREGLEFQVSMPQVILKEINGETYEPYERASIEVPEEYVGNIMQYLSQRHGQLQDMYNKNDFVHLEFLVPSRGLIGFRTYLLTETRGYGIIDAVFEEYLPWSGELAGRGTGTLVSSTQGLTTNYGLKSAQDRGTLFIKAGEEVYEGMIIGESNTEYDNAINVCKSKKMTNMRAAGKDEAIQLRNERELSLEEAMSFLSKDEYLEVTPHHKRLRKAILDTRERERQHKAKKR